MADQTSLQLERETVTTLERKPSKIKRMRANTGKFFGVAEADEDEELAWQNRRMRIASHIGGGLNEDYAKSRQTIIPGMSMDSAFSEQSFKKKSVFKMSVSAIRHQAAKDGGRMKEVSVSTPSKASMARRRSKRSSRVSRLASQLKIDEDSEFLSSLREQMAEITTKPKKRQLGIGNIGKLWERKLRGSILKEVKTQIDELDDHRPYFTYWITFVQTVIFITTVSVYGFAPVGISTTSVPLNVRMPNLAIQTESRIETDNLWIGPRQADLIHLGAKYSPCMRVDDSLNEAINLDIAEESTSACCVRKDGSGCVQSVQSTCDNILNFWKKWSHENPGPDGRVSGSVCGQDPRYCENPASTPPVEWPDEITKWPLCISSIQVNQSLANVKGTHMACEIVGRPCCFGIQGECIITTDDHCGLLRGFFHSEATLCAQVKCFEEVCGMIPFARPDTPDQFYRLATSMFLHGGIVHLVITIGFQMWIMRDLEKLLGAVRTLIIYFGSGVAGNLASCTFIPYQVEVGPSGAQFGIAACLLVEVIQSYQMYKHPHLVIVKLSIPFILFFGLGLLPWLDNWSHIFGFCFGFLLAFSLLPYITFGHFDRRRKLITVIVCLGASTGLFALLIIIFYFAPITDCHWCRYLNCIPITETFCDSTVVTFKKNSTYSEHM